MTSEHRVELVLDQLAQFGYDPRRAGRALQLHAPSEMQGAARRARHLGQLQPRRYQRRERRRAQQEARRRQHLRAEVHQRAVLQLAQPGRLAGLGRPDEHRGGGGPRSRPALRLPQPRPRVHDRPRRRHDPLGRAHGRARPASSCTWRSTSTGPTRRGSTSARPTRWRSPTRSSAPPRSRSGSTTSRTGTATDAARALRRAAGRHGRPRHRCHRLPGDLRRAPGRGVHRGERHPGRLSPLTSAAVGQALPGGHLVLSRPPWSGPHVARTWGPSPGGALRPRRGRRTPLPVPAAGRPAGVVAAERYGCRASPNQEAGITWHTSSSSSSRPRRRR